MKLWHICAIIAIVWIIFAVEHAHAADGKASFYSAHGKRGACGLLINDYSMTAATPPGTGKCGDQFMVINRKTNKSVIVTRIDSGPFVKGRIIDLSPGAFDRIANRRQGVIKVQVIYLGRDRRYGTP